MSKIRTKFNPRGSGNRFRKNLSKVSRGKQVFINKVGDEPIPEPVDKTQLAAYLAFLDGLDLQEEDYTEESWMAYAQALSVAEAVVDDLDADQPTVDQALQNLQDAYEGLVLDVHTPNLPEESSECDIKLNPNDPLLAAFGFPLPTIVDDYTARIPDVADTTDSYIVTLDFPQDANISWGTNEIRVIELELRDLPDETNIGWLSKLGILTNAATAPELLWLVVQGNYNRVDVNFEQEFPMGGGEGGNRPVAEQFGLDTIFLLGLQGTGDIWVGSRNSGIIKIADAWSNGTYYRDINSTLYPEWEGVLKDGQVDRLVLNLRYANHFEDYKPQATIQSNVASMKTNFEQSFDAEYLNSHGVDTIRSFCGDGKITIG